MADIRVDKEYVVIKNNDTGEVEMCEYFENARIETMQEISHTPNLEEVVDALPIPEDGRLEKNKIYLTADSELIHAKENMVLTAETDLEDVAVFAKATPIKEVTLATGKLVDGMKGAPAAEELKVG
jgi:hypothetical protein